MNTPKKIPCLMLAALLTLISFHFKANSAAPPTIMCPAGGVTAECTGGLTPVTYTATAVDSTGAALPVTCTPPSGTGFRMGTSNVVCSATDTAGNVSTCSFTVRVVDTTPPRVFCPTNMTVQATNGVSAIVQYIASTSDQCGLRSFVCAPPPGSALPIGITTVRCDSVDSTGNSNFCTFTVTVTSSNLPPNCVVHESSAVCGTVLGTAGNPSVISLNGVDACVVLDGSDSTDPDGDPLTFAWSVDGKVPVTGAVVTTCLESGCHTITLTVSDGRQTCSQTFNICVVSACEAVQQCILLVDAAAIPQQNKRALLVSLNAACASFQRGNYTAGVNQLQAFEAKVRAQISRNYPGIAQSFFACAGQIIDSVDCVVSMHGNNGVGNGVDPQPPGNPPENDGPGSGPGHPGNKP